MPDQREFEEAACHGKERMTAEVAKKVAERMRRNGRARITTYRCNWCNAFHVGQRK